MGSGLAPDRNQAAAQLFRWRTARILASQQQNWRRAQRKKPTMNDSKNLLETIFGSFLLHSSGGVRSHHYVFL